MELNIQTLNVTTLTEGIIAHGVNCQLAMGSGIALALMNKWPKMRGQYMTMPSGNTMLGYADPVLVEDNIVIINCYTQEYCGNDGRRYADIQSVTVSMEAAFKEAVKRNLPLYAPQIGCGLGGLDWESEVKPIFEALNNTYKDTVEFTVCVWP